MAEQIKTFAGVRSRSRPWFDSLIAATADLLPGRDEMFINELDVIAHLAFAFAKREVGARVNVRLLTLESAEDYYGDLHVLVTYHEARVDFLDPAQHVAVITLEDTSQSLTIRTDTVVQIDATVAALDLDPDKVEPLEPVRL